MLTVDQPLRARILEAWESLPEEIRGHPASEAALRAFEADHGPIPEAHRWFLSACGGGIVGADRVDDIEELRGSHAKFHAELNRPGGWTMRDVFVIGWDGGGNPFGINRTTGRILLEDHTFGGIHEVASSLEEFVLRGLLGAT